MPKNLKSTIALIMAGGLLSGLAGCSGDSGSSTTTTAGPTSASATSGTATSGTATSTTGGGDGATGTATSTAADTGPDDIQPMPAMPTEFDGIIKDVKLTKCDIKKGSAVAEGTAKNTAKTARDILVGVSWLKEEAGGDSLALKFFTASDVGAGKSVDFELKAKLGGDAARCVMQAKSFKAGSLKDAKKKK